MNNHYDNSKEIVISDNDISNINNKTGMVESVTTNPKIFSNFILNSLTNVGFTVLVDKTCQLEYKVKIESGKKIITNNKSYNVMMRVPVYTQENSGFYGDFYEFLLKHNTELDKPISYNKKLISEFDKKLVFDKYKAARKFSKAQI